MADRRRPGAHRPEPEAPLSGVLLRGLRDALRGAPMKKSAQVRLEKMGLIECRGFDKFSKLTAKGIAALQSATP